MLTLLSTCAAKSRPHRFLGVVRVAADGAATLDGALPWEDFLGPADAPLDALPQIRDFEIRHLPVSVRIDSTLTGLEVNLPEPLAKDADEAMAALRGEVRPIDDLRSTAEYRLRVTENLVRRFWSETR